MMVAEAIARCEVTADGRRLEFEASSVKGFKGSRMNSSIIYMR